MPTTGKWAPGQSGNPAGRIRGTDKWWRHKMNECNGREEILEFLLSTMRNPQEPFTYRFKAAVELLNRSEGLPKVLVDVSHEDQQLTAQQARAELVAIATEHLRELSPQERYALLAAVEDPAHNTEQ